MGVFFLPPTDNTLGSKNQRSQSAPILAKIIKITL